MLIGWLLYLAAAIGTSVGRELAYPAAMALSILSLLASIPQPEHYSLVSSGRILYRVLILFDPGNIVKNRRETRVGR